jgi:hypothetical protein
MTTRIARRPHCGAEATLYLIDEPRVVYITNVIAKCEKHPTVANGNGRPSIA